MASDPKSQPARRRAASASAAATPGKPAPAKTEPVAGLSASASSKPVIAEKAPRKGSSAASAAKGTGPKPAGGKTAKAKAASAQTAATKAASGKSAPRKATPGKATAARAAARKTTRAGAAGKRGVAAGNTPVRPVRDLDRPEWYFNRELSWIEFNQRVLEEAQDPTNPPLERMKFLAIVASNLDEFFEIRVAGLQQQAETRPFAAGIDGLPAARALDEIARRVRKLVADQYRCYSNQVVPTLAAAGIDLVTVGDLDDRGRSWAQTYFAREVFPVLTPLAVDPAHPFPQLSNKSLNLAVELRVPNTPGKIDGMLRDEQHVEFRLGVVQVPRLLPRLLEVPPEYSPAGRRVYVFLSSLISAYVSQLFPGLELLGCYAFRVTRNSELYLDEDEADNLLEAMREQLARRRRGDAVRLEVQRGCDPAVVSLLLRTFELDPEDLYEVDGPINLTRLMAIYSSENRPDLKDKSFTPATSPALRGVENAEELFAALRHGDVLLHHPYESFASVIRFIQAAAEDPSVLAIKMTLYRTSKDSPIVRALMRAAENGKQVTALVELKARFDEENNIAWARAMEESGVHVVYGLVGLKTHSKLALVVRREGHEIRRYVHLGTGNYNEVTARIYTDIGLLTCHPEIGEDTAKIFNLLTGMSQFPGLKKLIMAPFDLDQEFVSRIEREAAHARRLARHVHPEAGGAHIIVKMNSLVDPGVIQALYRASQAGVRVDLIIRGICCLRPGVPGLSENIRVRSIIGRFLEHSRLFYFANGGEPEILCGSADWMPRNFYRRVEVVYPILDAAIRERVLAEVLHLALEDNTKARELGADGSYRLEKRKPQETPLGYQSELLSRYRAIHKTGNTLESRAPDRNVLELTPRPAPLASVAPADGLPGTGGDPVLVSLQQSLQAPLRAELNLPAAGEAARPRNESREEITKEVGQTSLETVKSDALTAENGPLVPTGGGVDEPSHSEGA